MPTKLFNLIPQLNFRKILRQNSTKSELLLWSKLRNNQLGFKFRRQYGVGKYILDFYCPKLKLAVEVDGLTHSDEKVYDKDVIRENYLKNLGIVVKRYSTQQIFDKLDEVLDDLYYNCANENGPHPNPLLSKEREARSRSIIVKERGILLLIFLLSSFFIPTRVFCYDTNVAHPNIAELAAQLYNKKFPDNKLSASDIAQIKLGATEEDTPTRWYNHFYDPIYNRGVWFRNDYESAKEWSNDSEVQKDFSLGDNSWPRAIVDFQDNNRALAMRELGHTIHLISDMFVPAHTRDDIHPAGDSYEQFVKNNWSTVADDLKYNFQNVSSLNTAFYNAAKYSNANFYSDDTIESLHYNTIQIVGYKIIQINKLPTYLAQDKETKLIYATDGTNWKTGLKQVDNDVILTSYSTHLLPQAIGYSAGIIDLFFRESQKPVEKLSWLRITAKGLLDSITGAVITFAENGKDYLIQNVFGEEGENIGKEILHQVDIQMTAENQKLRSETVPQKSPPITVIPTTQEESLSTSTTTPSPVIPTDPAQGERVDESLVATSTTSTYSVTNTPYYYSSGYHDSPVVVSTTTPTSTPETPTTTPTSTPETPTSTPTTTPDTAPPQIPTITILQTDPDNPILQISATSTDASSTKIFFDFEISTDTPDNFLPFFTSTTSSTVNYAGTRGHTYFFRARAIDDSNNLSDYSQSVTTTLNYITLSGEQTTQTRTLTAQNSPYLINGSNCYIVQVGAKLTIESGTKIQIAPYLCLIINGELDAQGTADSRIIFEPISPGVYWNQIIFNSATGTIKFTDIIGGNRNTSRPHEIDGIILAENSYLELDNVILNDSYELGIDLHAKNGITKIFNSIISDTEKSNNQYVFNTGIHVKSGELWLNNVQFSNLSFGVWGGTQNDPDLAKLYLENMSDTNFTNVDAPYLPPNWLEIQVPPTTSTTATPI